MKYTHLHKRVQGARSDPSPSLKDCAGAASFAAQASPGAGQGEPGDGIVRIDEERGYTILPSGLDNEEDVGLYEELV